MFAHDTKPDKTILISSKHQLTLELSPLSEFPIGEPGQSHCIGFWSVSVHGDIDLTLTSCSTSGTRQFVSIGIAWVVV